MFRVGAQHRRRVMILLDILVVFLAVLSAYWLREAWVGEPLPFLSYLGIFPPMATILVFLLARFDAYQGPRGLTVVAIARAVGSTIAIALMLFLTFMFVLKFKDVSRLFVVAFAGLTGLGLIGIRTVQLWRYRASIRHGNKKERVLIVGTGRRARRLATSVLRRAHVPCEIVGYLDRDAELIGERILGAPVLGTLGDITSVLQANVVDDVLLALPRGMIGELDKVVRACEEEGICVRMMADLFPVPAKRVTLDDLAGIPLLTFDAVAYDEWKVLLKRGIDFAAAGALLVLLLPVMALVALAIKLDSPGPILFVQDRIGLNKRRFRFVKFRSMVANAEACQAEVEHLNEADGPVFKIRHDPRVTRVGRFLRRTSLDELPQLFNVLTGDMSLVGPRPLPCRDVTLFDRAVQRRRFSFKPGLTCLWQVSGRSNLPFDEWLKLDLWYIDNWSIVLDLKILLRTVPAVLRGTGAA